MNTVNQDEVEQAIKQLDRSDKGRQAMHDLLTLLENGGMCLDSSNQLAVMTLLRGAWGPLPSTVRDLLVEQVQGV